MTRGAASVLVSLMAVCAAAAQDAEVPLVEVRERPGLKRVDVSVDARPFTAYVWPERLAKPVLYPIRSARGTLVTRGFPLDPRPGERVDHPHQVGLWFNYGDVNGVDFWNNSEAQAPAEQAKMGRIRNRRVVSSSSGRGQGELEVAADWIMPDGSIVRHEDEDKTRESIGRFSKRDADTYFAYEEWIGRIGAILSPMLWQTPPTVGSHRDCSEGSSILPSPGPSVAPCVSFAMSRASRSRPTSGIRSSPP